MNIVPHNWLALPDNVLADDGLNIFTTPLRYVGGLVWDFLPPRLTAKPPTEIPQRGPLF